MQHFQSVLIAVGVMAIASVLVHGYMLSRKAKAAVLESASEVDGFIASTHTNPEIEVNVSDLSIKNENDTSEEEYIDFSQALAEEHEVIFLDGVKNNDNQKDSDIDDIFNSETVQENIVSFSFKKSKKKNDQKSESNILVEEGLAEQDVTETVLEKAPQQLQQKNNKVAPTKEQKPDVFILNVVAKEGTTIGGLQLLQFFLTSGFRFGEMSLFHRHLHSDGTGPILFSIANMIAPGTFDPHQMEKFDSQGVSFFISAPNPDINIKEAFEMMLTAVQQLSDEFECTVLNDQREPLTEQQFRAYHERLMRYV